MTDKNNSLDILKERYVNGEITKEQFDEMKEALESVNKPKGKISNKKKIGITISILFFILVIIGAAKQETTTQNIPQSTVNENPLSLTSSYLQDLEKFTSNQCDTSASPTCIAIVNTLQQDCSNPTLLQVEKSSCALTISSLNMRQSYLNSLSTTQQQTPTQPTVNESPLSLSSAYLNDFGKYTSNQCDTSASPTCIAIVNTLQQDCSNPTLLQIQEASCNLLNSSLNMRQSYLNSLSPTTAQNWAGYIAESDFYNPQPVVEQVSASWQVVPIPTSNLDQEMAQWIGIGGYANIGGSTDESLIQVGTSSENVCKQVFNSAYQLVPQCTLNYTAWYEIYPHNYETPLMSVNAGDTVTALISCGLSSVELFKQDTCEGKTQEWTIVIIDQTKRKAGIMPFSNVLHTKFSSSLLTADWIVERRCPSSLFSSCDLAVDLPEFGSAAFTNSTTQIGKKFGSINDFKHVNISMTSNGQSSGALLAYPSDLSNNGLSFTITSGYQTSNPTTQQNPTNQPSSTPSSTLQSANGFLKMDKSYYSANANPSEYATVSGKVNDPNGGYVVLTITYPDGGQNQLNAYVTSVGTFSTPIVLDQSFPPGTYVISGNYHDSDLGSVSFTVK